MHKTEVQFHICKKIDVDIFLQILTELLRDFSKEAILFLIYLLADKGK